MIPKFICWIFGHNRKEEWVTLKYHPSDKVVGYFAGKLFYDDWSEGYYKKPTNCPRCGANL